MRSVSEGFTLLELLVVLFIISLGMALVLPRLTVGWGYAEQKRFVTDFVQTLRRANTMALNKGKVVVFAIDPEARTYGIEGERRGEIPLEVEIRGEGGAELEGQFRLCFYPDGTATGAELIVNFGRRSWTLRVHPLLGTVRVEEEG